MSCCGQARATLSALRSTETRTPGRRKLAPAAVRYVGNRSVHVRGSATGRRYSFTTNGEVQGVDAQDVAGIVRTRLFVRF